MRKTQKDIWFNYIEKTDAVQCNETITDNNITKTEPDSKEKFPIIVDYCKIGTELAKSYKNILNNNKDFNNFQFVTAYKIHKNLGRVLVRRELWLW